MSGKPDFLSHVLAMRNLAVSHLHIILRIYCVARNVVEKMYAMKIFRNANFRLDKELKKLEQATKPCTGVKPSVMFVDAWWCAAGGAVSDTDDLHYKKAEQEVITPVTTPVTACEIETSIIALTEANKAALTIVMYGFSAKKTEQHAWWSWVEIQAET